MDNINDWDWEFWPITPPGSKSLELYDYQTPGIPKAVWHRKEFLETANHLMTFQQALRDEFLAGHSSLEEAVIAKNMPSVIEGRGFPLDKIGETRSEGFTEAELKLHAWKTITIKYEHKKANQYKINEDARIKYPTAYKLMEQYGDDCGIATYSVIEPNSVIDRHTGPENRDGEYLRIHIPLIVPSGEIFFEVMGQVVYWNDIWGFNNQLIHSAHNYTNEYRLVFLIDLKRTSIGLDPGTPFNEEWQIHAKPFVREKSNDKIYQ